MNSLEANAAQNAIQREQLRLREPSARAHEKVLMYWWQARNDITGHAGDKAKIESIYDCPVKTLFMDDSIKSAILLDEPYPFKKAFIIDVVVETIEGKPMLYKITRFHEAIDR